MRDADVTQAVNREYADFDALAEEAQAWDLDLRQLDPGPFRGRLMQFAVGNLLVSKARFCRALKQTGNPPPGLRTVAIAADPGVAFEWRGVKVDGRSLMVFPRGAELDVVSDPSFAVYTCSFPESLLCDVAESMKVPSLDERSNSKQVIQCDNLAGVRHFLAELCSRVASAKIVDPDFLSEVTWELPRLLLESSGPEREDTCRAPKESVVLRAAATFIEQRADQPITVQDVSSAVGVSMRTLQLAFADRYRMSPKQYMQAIRLNLARSMLRDADPSEQNVAQVANKLSFWHMGQFAADYRKHFGELPSSTLRRATTGNSSRAHRSARR